MEEEPLKIFIVDDDAVSRMALQGLLQNTSHQLTEISSGTDCLLLMDAEPDIVILDFEMPQMNGVQVCANIRAMDLQRQPHIIFVSVHDDMETQMSAYAVGANDYLIKPCLADELKQKLATAQQYIQTNKSLDKNYQFAQQAAFTAMSSMGELGVVLQFLRDSFECQDLGQLVDLVLNTLSSYDLNGFIKVYNQYEEVNRSTRQVCSPLETSILEYTGKLEQRIVTTNKYLAFNYPNISMVITELPDIDGEMLGRVRDHLATLAEGAGARIKALETEQQFIRQANGVVKASKEISELLEIIEHQQHKSRVKLMKIVADYSDSLETSFFQLGLMESQEEQLMDMVKTMHGDLDELMEQSESIAKRLHDANIRLGHLRL